MATTALVYTVLLGLSLTRAQSNVGPIPRPYNGQCTTQYYGNIFGQQLQLQDVYLPPPQRDWDIQIPQVCNAVGMVVKVCDNDPGPAPTVIINSMTDVYVRRNAYDIRTPSKVATTLFCAAYDYPVPIASQNVNAPKVVARPQ